MNIIELSQTKSGRVIENGHYEVKLPHPITLEPNDSLKIFSSYIDTTANNDNKITIPATQLDISFGYYWRDWHNVPGLSFTPAHSVGSLFSNKEFIFSHFTEQSSGDMADCEVLTKINFTYHKKNYSFGLYGTAHFTYEDPQGHTHNLNIKIPTTQPNNAPYSKNLNIILKKNTLQFINEKDFKKVRNQNCVVEKYFYSAVSDKDTYSPVINKISIKLNAGDYDPENLAQIISEKMTANNGNNYINNNLLLVSGDYNPAHYRFLRTDGKQEFKIGTPSAYLFYYLIGSSQFALEYDNNTNLFSFSYLHTPQYSSEGEIVVKYLDNSNNTYPIAKMGGIYLNALKAYNINDDGSIGDENHLFWQNVMGFNIDDICPDFTYFEHTIGGAIDANVFSCNLTPGETSTDGFIGTDSTINKKGDYWKLQIPGAGDPGYPFQSSLNSTVPIYATKAYNEAVFQGSHFFIEIDSNFKTELIDEIDTKSKIMSIVNRYYSVNNFTTADGSGSLIYQHISTEPVILSSFIVKILDYNNELANVGEKNTVFLQLIKAQPEEDLNEPLENKQ